MALGRWILKGVLLAAALSLWGAGPTLTMTASCGANCVPQPTAFEVPKGQVASAFRVSALHKGSPCGDQNKPVLEGFSIRNGSRTVLVYYRDQGAVISDPTPLEDLQLPPGRYALYAVPASGASATVEFEMAVRN